jgi:hypothetical protein
VGVVVHLYIDTCKRKKRKLIAGLAGEGAQEPLRQALNVERLHVLMLMIVEKTRMPLPRNTMA